MLNRVVICGRLPRDIELRQSKSGSSFAGFSLAVDRDFKNKETGERDTDWLDVVVNGKTAEFAAKFFHKGDCMIVDGRLRKRSYTDKDGNNRSVVEIAADNVYFASSGNSSGGSGQKNADKKPDSKPSSSKGSDDDEDGELPF